MTATQDGFLARAAVIGLAMASLLGAAQRPGLDAVSASELQKLLQLQQQQTAVQFQQRQPKRRPESAFDRLFLWNEIALETTAIDHTPVQPGEARVFAEQFGPTRSSRAMAIVHIAMFEAVNAVGREYRSYTGLPAIGNKAVSLDLAIAQAAHDALTALYPSQTPRLDALLAVDATCIEGKKEERDAGEALGKAAAVSILARREGDGSEVPEPTVGGPFTPAVGAGKWSPDPVSKLKLYLGAYWGQVKPFTMTAGNQFRAPAPPALTDRAYTAAFGEVKRLGGDPNQGTTTERTGAQTLSGIFWSYDGTPWLCAPPRLYNQVARAIVLEQGLNRVTEAARVLALINTAMADAAIAAWDSKWFYQYWRPVTAIRSADQGGNKDVEPDPLWYPLGAQATNTRGPNFTPPFPAYVSGHATIGGALFGILRHFYPDETSFTFVSDEWNGLNKDASGVVRPLTPHSFASFSQAEEENGFSRVYLGVHWRFDAEEGKRMGNKVADWVWGHAFEPLQP